MHEHAVLAWDGGGRLELRELAGGQQHVLQERPLVRGDAIELMLADGYWLRGTYEWSGLAARWPGLRVELGGPWQTSDVERPPAAVLALHPDAIVRWSR